MDRRRGRLAGTLVADSSEKYAAARCQTQSLAAECDRCLHPGPLGTRKSITFPACEKRNPASAGDARSHRPAADAWELEAFLADDSPEAYEKVVDRLLASPRYGEHFALDWLDAARYSDSNGYQQERTRTMWPWRDWVVKAYNSNMPYDQFTIEQLAGDLLKNPTTEQLVATGFHRNHMLNGEGGRIAEESRVEYVVDRVETTGIVWLGLTAGCARCHDHKFDPLTQKEFYSLYALFNSIDETGSVDRGGNANPVLPLPTPEQQARRKQLEAERTTLQEQLKQANEEEKKNIQKQLDQNKKSLDSLNKSASGNHDYAGAKRPPPNLPLKTRPMGPAGQVGGNSARHSGLFPALAERGPAKSLGLGEMAGLSESSPNGKSGSQSGLAAFLWNRFG